VDGQNRGPGSESAARERPAASNDENSHAKIQNVRGDSWVGCQRRWENLDGDLTLQLRVRRPIDFPHPTHAELRGDFVDAEASAGRESQADLRGLYGRTAVRTGLLLSDDRSVDQRSRSSSHNSIGRRGPTTRAVVANQLVLDAGDLSGPYSYKHRRMSYCARYAGASVCVTKSSKLVEVVLRALRPSTDFTRPSLNALAIST
jgi:hypothetical protein